MSVKKVRQVGGTVPSPQAHSLDAGVDMLELTLNENGMIRECSKTCARCLGCTPGELLWQHVSVLLPQLAGIPLVLGGQINPRLRYLCHIGRQFELVGKSGVRLLSEVFFNDVESLGRHYLHLVIRPVRSLSAAPA